MVRESSDGWWALPGGGVDHGETVESTLVREVEEELGVSVKEVGSDFQIVYYSIGSVVNGIPRMNLFFKASVPEELFTKADHVAQWKRFSKDEFLHLKDMHPSYDRAKLVGVIFGN